MVRTSKTQLATSGEERKRAMWQVPSTPPSCSGPSLSFCFHLCALNLGMKWPWVRSSDAASSPSFPTITPPCLHHSSSNKPNTPHANTAPIADTRQNAPALVLWASWARGTGGLALGVSGNTHPSCMGRDSHAHCWQPNSESLPPLQLASEGQRRCLLL